MYRDSGDLSWPAFYLCMQIEHLGPVSVKGGLFGIAKSRDRDELEFNERSCQWPVHPPLMHVYENRNNCYPSTCTYRFELQIAVVQSLKSAPASHFRSRRPSTYSIRLSPEQIHDGVASSRPLLIESREPSRGSFVF